ncbi:MAG TPA: phosphoglucosamine mutase, partial [Pirellulaceae bacterium]|nr:phosphoglucosamine mutase [Pirellulaceae bacterium]
MPDSSRPQPIISVSGLRGTIGSTLTPDRAIAYVAAFAASAPAGPIVLSRDGRTTGPMLAEAIRSALVGCGRDVLDAGVAATPTVGVLVRSLAAAGAVQISASHNPPEYNGIKLFGPDGRLIDAAEG